MLRGARFLWVGAAATMATIAMVACIGDEPVVTPAADASADGTARDALPDQGAQDDGPGEGASPADAGDGAADSAPDSMGASGDASDAAADGPTGMDAEADASDAGSCAVACGGTCVEPQTDQVHCGATAGCGVDGGSGGVACGTATCIAGSCERIVFVTSATYPGNFGGLAQAGSQCQQLAQSAHLLGAFLPWLADDTHSPSTLFVKSSVPYVRVDGVQVAANWAGLTSGTLQAPIDVTETGQTVGNGNPAWTGANPDGTPLPDLTNVNNQTGDQCCNGWTNTSVAVPPWAGVGYPTHTDGSWSYETTTEGACADVGTARLYCVQQ